MEAFDKIYLEELGTLANKFDNYIIIEKRLWVGGLCVDINHFDENLKNPLDYLEAFKKMIKLKKEIKKEVLQDEG